MYTMPKVCKWFTSERFRSCFGNVRMLTRCLDNTFVSFWYFRKNAFKVKIVLVFKIYNPSKKLCLRTIKPYEEQLGLSIRKKIRHITYSLDAIIILASTIFHIIVKWRGWFSIVNHKHFIQFTDFVRVFSSWQSLPTGKSPCIWKKNQ